MTDPAHVNPDFPTCPHTSITDGSCDRCGVSQTDPAQVLLSDIKNCFAYTVLPDEYEDMYQLIAAALRTAEARGRRETWKAAAKMAEDFYVTDCTIDERDPRAVAIAKAIREAAKE